MHAGLERKERGLSTPPRHESWALNGFVKMQLIPEPHILAEYDLWILEEWPRVLTWLQQHTYCLPRLLLTISHEKTTLLTVASAQILSHPTSSS
jgi:hypothetical protein